MQSVQKNEYNKFVCSVQSEAYSWGLENRTITSRGVDGVISRAYFQVYYDGHWVPLASERPFVGEDNDGMIDPERWLTLQAQMARDIGK